MINKLKRIFGGRVLLLNLLLYETLNLFIFLDVSSLNEGVKDILNKKDGIISCQNRRTGSSEVSPIQNALGIKIRPVLSGDVKQYSLESFDGVVIVSLAPSSPLTRIGFEKDDLMLEINGHSIKGPAGFSEIVKNLEPQQRITIRALDHRTGRIGFVQIFMP